MGVLQLQQQHDQFTICCTLQSQKQVVEKQDDGPLYFEHAEKYGPLLNIKVAQKKINAGSVPMAGFPFFQLDRFLKILVQDLYKHVAISEEFAKDVSTKAKSGEPLERRVTRVITPGTLIDEKFMDPYANNFLLAVHPLDQSCSPSTSTHVPAEVRTDVLNATRATNTVGLAWLDVSTGDFFTQAVPFSTLASSIARIGAREIVLSDGLEGQLRQSISDLLDPDSRLLTYHNARFTRSPISSWASMLETPVPVEDEGSFSPEEIAAGSILLAYVRDKLQGLGIKLQPPVRRQENECMSIDKNTMRGLEVLETSKDGVAGGKGSLLHTVRRTVTKSGARLLRDWIASPSTSIQTINKRLDLVSQLLESESTIENVVNLLRRSYDCQRLVQKFSMGRGDADDLVALLKTIEVMNSIKKVLESNGHVSETKHPSTDKELFKPQPLQDLYGRLLLDGPNELAWRISQAIDEESLMQNHRREEAESANLASIAQGVLQSDGSAEEQEPIAAVLRSRELNRNQIEQDSVDGENWIMRKTASSTLQNLHQSLLGLLQEKEELTLTLREQIGAPSLSLRWTPGSGHICHVKGSKDVRQSTRAVVAARDARSTKSTRTFYNSDWTSLGGRIDQLKLQVRAEEQRVLYDLRERVVLNLANLRRNAAVLDELDIGCAFATLANEEGFVRPVVNTSKAHRIIGGRHPTVKVGLEEQGRTFVRNDCFVGERERVWLITGPNMGGKSTFLRQNALLSILAQAGSFVPADHAEMGIVDQIFTRVGSADNLYKDQSTFMVEMLETAVILHQATPRSFVIMDEIGRGTTPEDGIAVAFACLHHLYHRSQCRTLFATHFHIIADLARDFACLGCYCTDVAESPTGSFSYLHRLRRGVNRQSHALKVARLAGIPDSAIHTAQAVLESLKSGLFQQAGANSQPTASS
ncbi:MAG: hypothetical protein Q9167_006517 [Letrouitia subvulpina]